MYRRGPDSPNYVSRAFVLRPAAVLLIIVGFASSPTLIVRATEAEPATAPGPSTAPATRPATDPIWVCLARLHASGDVALAFSADGGRLLTAGGTEARVWDAHTWRPQTDPLTAEHPLAAAAISPDGKRMATAAGRDAVVWNVITGQVMLTLPHPAAVRDVTYDRDGKRLATACMDRAARVWDPVSGERLAELRHDGPVRSVEFSPDGRRLLTGTVLEGNDPNRTMGGKGVPIDPNDPNAAGAATVWDLAGRKKLWTFKEERQYCRGRPAFSPDGHWVGVPADEGVFVHDANSGERLGEPLVAMQGDFTIVDFSRSGGRVLAAGYEGPNGDKGAAEVGAIRPGNPKRRERPWTQELHGFAPMSYLRSAAISPDGRSVALAAPFTDRVGGAAGVWDVDSGKQVLDLDDAERRFGLLEEGDRSWRATRVAFSPDGTLVAFALARGQEGKPALVVIWGALGAGR